MSKAKLAALLVATLREIQALYGTCSFAGPRDRRDCNKAKREDRCCYCIATKALGAKP